MDIFKTNFAGDTSTLYANTGDGLCEDRTFAGGLGLNTRWLGWGAGFADFDNDGWLDIFLTNGHVYPEVRQLQTEAGYEQRKVVYRNLGNGRFEDVTRAARPAGRRRRRPARGAAFGDIDNDGTVDVAINNVHDTPDLFLTIGARSQPLAARSGWPARGRTGARSARACACVAGGGRAVAGGARRRQLHLAERPARALRARRGATRSIGSRCAGRTDSKRVWQGVAANQVLTLTEGTGTPMPQRP